MFIDQKVWYCQMQAHTLNKASANARELLKGKLDVHSKVYMDPQSMDPLEHW